MNIIVYIRQVYDPQNINIDRKGMLILDNTNKIINPDDKSAIEVALITKEKLGGEITAVAIGDKYTDFALREALAMGVDKAVLIDTGKIHDISPISSAELLAYTIKDMNFDLILTGNDSVSITSDCSGITVAELLRIPHIGNIVNINFENDNIIAKKCYEDNCELVKIKKGSLLAISSINIKPRYMFASNIFEVYNKEILTLNISDIAEKSNIKINTSTIKTLKYYNKEITRLRQTISGSEDEITEKIVGILNQTNFNEKEV